MEYLDTILTVAGLFGGGGSVVFIYAKKALFLYRGAQQAVDSFEELKTANQTIYNKIQADPNKKELALILSGGVKKIKGLSGLK